MTEVNTPSSEKPTNAAIPAGTKTGRTSGGRPGHFGRTTRGGCGCGTVSGRNQSTANETATRVRWTMKGSFKGQGAYWANSPASSGPQPSPPMLAAVAAKAARPSLPGGAHSITYAVAVPVNRPADSPDSRRPT